MRPHLQPDTLEQERVLATPSENGHLMAVALIQLE